MVGVRLLGWLTIVLSIVWCHPALAQRPTKRKAAAAEKRLPDLADVRYGPHQRNVLDLWKAKSDKPTLLVVFIHGGGFRGGSQEALSSIIQISAST